MGRPRSTRASRYTRKTALSEPRDDADEPPRKGRSNAILTYETVEEIKLGIQETNLKLDHLAQDVGKQGKTFDDHEARLRALELTQAAFIAANTSKWSTGAFLWSAALGAIAVIISALNYLSP